MAVKTLEETPVTILPTNTYNGFKLGIPLEGLKVVKEYTSLLNGRNGQEVNITISTSWTVDGMNYQGEDFRELTEAIIL